MPEQRKEQHVSIDIETMGDGHNAAVVSIGAARFDPYIVSPFEGDDPYFYQEISLDDSVRQGFDITPSTIRWWLGQSDYAREAVKGDDVMGVVAALAKFAAWLAEKGPGGLPLSSGMNTFTQPRNFVWSHATFDAVILENAYKRTGVPRPWSYRDVRDLRTLEHITFGRYDKDNWKRVDLHSKTHNALDDAIRQAQMVNYCMRRIRAGRS